MENELIGAHIESVFQISVKIEEAKSTIWIEKCKKE